MDRPSRTKSNGFFPTPTASMGTGPSTSGRAGGMNLQTAVVTLSLSLGILNLVSGSVKMEPTTGRPYTVGKKF